MQLAFSYYYNSSRAELQVLYRAITYTTLHCTTLHPPFQMYKAKYIQIKQTYKSLLNQTTRKEYKTQLNYFTYIHDQSFRYLAGGRTTRPLLVRFLSNGAALAVGGSTLITCGI